VFENRVFKKISGPKKDEVEQRTAGDRILRRHARYSSPNNIRMIKSRRMRWAGNVAQMGYKETFRQGFGAET
jgi:hypothetical protein